MLRTLHYRNFRLFFVGQLISLIGTWMQQIAMSWLVYRLTNSSFLLGIVGFASQIPTFFLTPFAGVLIDRWNRHHILITTQTLAMIQALILAFLALTHTIQIWHVIVLGLFLGVINAIDIPARQAFLIDLIEKREDLGNAIALNSSMVNVTRLLGPSIAGMLIALVGEGMCFLLNGLSYLAVIIALLVMKITPRKSEVEKPHILEGLAAGFTYAFGFAPIRSVLLLLALTSLMGMPYGVLLPVFATDILQGGPYTLGFLMTCSGIGALVGAVYLTLRKSILGLGRWIVIASSVFGIGLIGFSLSRTLWLSLIFISLAGFGMMVQMAATNTVLQTIVEDDKRGRVMSFYTVAFMGMTPFGSLLAGSLASKIGAPNTLIIGGICCILGSLVFASKLPALREMVRPIYVRLGIM
jgi:MFS family permease